MCSAELLTAALFLSIRSRFIRVISLKIPTATNKKHQHGFKLFPSLQVKTNPIKKDNIIMR